MMTPFQKEITQGLPEHLPAKRSVPGDVNRAPKRKDILSAKEKKLALENALRYFPAEWHEALATEFLEELKEFGAFTCTGSSLPTTCMLGRLKTIRAKRQGPRPSC